MIELLRRQRINHHPHQGGNRSHLLDQFGVLSRQQSLRPIARRLFRAAVDLDMHAVGSRSDRGQRHAGDQIGATGGMARIDHDR